MLIHISHDTAPAPWFFRSKREVLDSAFFVISITPDQGGITCGAIDEPWKSSKAIDERVVINFRDKNVVIARFCDKNVVIARFRDKNVVIGWEYYPLKSA